MLAIIKLIAKLAQYNTSFKWLACIEPISTNVIKLLLILFKDFIQIKIPFAPIVFLYLKFLFKQS